MQPADPATRVERLKRAFDNYEPLDDTVVAILRSTTPAERIEICIRATAGMRLLIAMAIRDEQPHWDEPAVQHELARRWSALPDD